MKNTKKTEQTKTLKLDTKRHLLNIGKCVDVNKRNMKGPIQNL